MHARGLHAALVLASCLLLASGAPGPQAAPPAGFELQPAWRCCPPGGFAFHFAVWCVDFLNDAAQIPSFVRHRDWFFAATCGSAVLLSTLLALSWNPWTAVRESIALGYPTVEWNEVLSVEAVVEGAATGLVAPYGMSLNSDLGGVAAISAFLGILLSTKAIGTLLYRNVDCITMDLALQAILPSWRRSLVLAWRLLTVGSELSLFALASAVLHPLLTCPFFLPSIIVNTISWKERTWLESLLFSAMGVGYWFSGSYTSLFLLQDRDEAQKYVLDPAGFILGAALLRVGALPAMMVLLDRPSGILPLGQLGRRMGWPVLLDWFVTPASAIGKAAAVCAGISNTHTSTGDAPALCRLPAFEHMSVGSAFFRAALLGMAATTTALHIVGLFFLLVCHRRYRRGDPDLELLAQLRSKHEEIKAWCEARRRHQQAAERGQLLAAPEGQMDPETV